MDISTLTSSKSDPADVAWSLPTEPLTINMLSSGDKLEDSHDSSATGSSRSDSPQLTKDLEKTKSKSNSKRNSISRTRSNNGYGCDGGIEDNNGGLAINGDLERRPVAERDPFEVRWDGGDSDPMNPRSLSMARKWVVVLIVSASSMCV